MYVYEITADIHVGVKKVPWKREVLSAVRDAQEIMLVAHDKIVREHGDAPVTFISVEYRGERP